VADFRGEIERLILRDWRQDDLDALWQICSDPQVMAMTGPVHERAETQAMLHRLMARAARDGHTFWALERKRDGRLIGFCGVGRGTVPQLERDLEIGWRLASDCWGQSYAREAAEGALAWTAANRPGEPVFAITSVGNLRSRGLMERLGMRYCEGMDFDHPKVDAGSALVRHVTYRKDELP
jgi:RimJ/RimL family protein N-acetyltransferase